MVIKEYPPIIENGKVVVEGTSDYDMNFKYTSQMKKRGVDCLSFFIDKEKQNKFIESKNDSEGNEHYFSGISWTEDFFTEDLMNLVLVYAEQNMTKPDMMMFAAQLQNYFLAIEEVDEDEEY